MIPQEIRRAVYIGAAIVLLVFAVLTLSWCADRSRLKAAKAEASVAQATGKALDTVAEQTPVIRQEQVEKERAVEQIQGADQPLPPGFGADLERVRRGARKADDPR